MKGDYKLRSAQEVAERTIALIGVFQAATGRDKEKIGKIFKENSMWSFLTPVEQEFILMTEENAQFLSMQFSWRAEAVYILLWVLNVLDFNQIPSDERNLEQISSFLRNDNFFTKISPKDAQLRDSEEIFNMLEKVYRIHGEIRDAHINEEHVNPNHNISIIYEWHYSLNWVTNVNVEWDDITTDT
ncbi:MAG: DUF4272 domain-containing protein [Promethearchaeota archaeon]